MICALLCLEYLQELIGGINSALYKYLLWYLCARKLYVWGKNGIKEEIVGKSVPKAGRESAWTLGVTDVSCHVSDISVWWLSSSWHTRPFLLHFLRLPTSHSPCYLLLFLGTLWHALYIQASSSSPEIIGTYTVCDVLLCFFLVGPSAMTGLDGIGYMLMTEYLFMNYYQKSFQQL